MPTSSVPRPRWLCVASGTSSRIRSTSSPKPGLGEPLGRSAPDETLRARAGVDPGRLDPDDAAGAGARRRGDPDQRDHLLGREIGDRRPAAQRPARDDPHLGPKRLLALDDLGRDPVGQHLDEQALAEHDVVDRLVEELGEARHVHALLVAREVDGALELCRHQDLLRAAADPDRLVDPRDACAREREPDRRRGRLEVATSGRSLTRRRRYRRSLERRRSLRIRPPVWQAAQYVIVCSSKSTRRRVSPQRGHGSP